MFSTKQTLINYHMMCVCRVSCSTEHVFKKNSDSTTRDICTKVSNSTNLTPFNCVHCYDCMIRLLYSFDFQLALRLDQWPIYSYINPTIFC